MATTLAEQRDAFLADMRNRARLRPHTLRAYRYELIAAESTLTAPLDTLSLLEIETWLSRGEAEPVPSPGAPLPSAVSSPGLFATSCVLPTRWQAASHRSQSGGCRDPFPQARIG